MKINKNSWHYKINRSVFNANKNVPESLCPYVRALLLRMFFISLLATLIGALCHMTGSGIMQMHPQWFEFVSQSPWILNSFTFVFGTLVVAGIAALSLAFIFGIVFGIIVIQESQKTEDFIDSIKKSDNIAVKYLIAKHNKYCPHIEFED